METTKDILDELTAISPLIAGMKKVNVFAVPQGYFETVGETVLACLREEHSLFNELGNKQPADIPAGYFDHLASSILNKIKAGEAAADEVSDISPLLFSIQNKNVFEVPDGYFENVIGNVFNNIKSIPVNEELEDISPLLHEIKNKNLFEVPGGYFEDVPAIVLEKVKTAHGKVIPMRRLSPLIKYAVAAMMTGVIAFGLYKYLDKTGAKVNVDNTAFTLDPYIEKGKNMDEKQFNMELENLSEADIAKYLEKNGDLSDMAALGNSIDESNLPSPDDYLLDESTLENYLKNIETITPEN